MNEPEAGAPRASSSLVTESHWRALHWYSVSRVLLAVLLLLTSYGYQRQPLLELHEPGRFRFVAIGYLVLGVLYLLAIGRGRPYFRLQLHLHLITDLIAIVMMMSMAGGIRGGLGVLIVVSVAAAAVVSSARTAALFAASGTLALLGETIARAFHRGEIDPSEFVLAGLTGAACFLTGLVVNWLAGRLQDQETLAARRGEDLRNQLAVTQRVIAELEIGVLIVTVEGKVRTMNRAAQQMIGVSGPHLAGLAAQGLPTLERLLGPAWRGLSALYLNWRDQSSSQPFEGEFSPLEGASVDAAPKLRLRFMRASDAPDSDAVLTLEDMRELEQRAQQLKLASMGRLSASIAHEIRNPLGAIRHANSLLAEQLSEARLQRLAGIVEHNTVRINRTIEDVLSISRRDRAVDESIDPVRFFPELVGEFGTLAGSASKRVDVQVRTTRAMAFDSNHLRQILTNLVGNALRYASKQEGAVRIEWLETAEHRLELRIADDGPGLSEDAIKHAFEPFYTTESRGTGLGLYLARELCSANGARIRYERVAEGTARHRGAFVIEPRASELGELK